MGTLAELKSRIASELNRSDLTTAIAAEVARSIERYASRRFWFNEDTRTTATVQGDATVAVPTGLRVIDQAFITIGGQKRTLDPQSLVCITDWLGTDAGEGQPTDYAYSGSTFTLYRTPNDAYTISVVGIYDLAAFGTDADSNAWTTEAADLIAYDAAERLARVKVRNTVLANDFRGLRDEALSRLRGETNRRLMRGVQPG